MSTTISRMSFFFFPVVTPPHVLRISHLFFPLRDHNNNQTTLHNCTNDLFRVWVSATATRICTRRSFDPDSHQGLWRSDKIERHFRHSIFPPAPFYTLSQCFFDLRTTTICFGIRAKQRYGIRNIQLMFLCSRLLWRHQFSELLALAGELLHIPERIPTFVATVLLSLASNILFGVWVLTSSPALKSYFRIIPHRQYCLPVMAHKEPLESSLFFFSSIFDFLLSKRSLHNFRQNAKWNNKS